MDVKTGRESVPKIIAFKCKGSVSPLDIARDLSRAAEKGELRQIVALTIDTDGTADIGYSTLSDSQLCYLKCMLDEHLLHRMIPTHQP